LPCGEDRRDCFSAGFREQIAVRAWDCIPPEVIRERISLANEINRILTPTINRRGET
jgi:hypothetical protein